jgi:crotonobetainyl-CoA:carnitine CoA-transferase CaiB-like acyl-CoA transferase
VANQAARVAPHNVFPTRGKERRIAIAVETDGQWCALVELMGSPPQLTDRCLAGVADRLAQREHIAACISIWTREQDGGELMARLQAAGVPSGVANRAPASTIRIRCHTTRSAPARSSWRDA